MRAFLSLISYILHIIHRIQRVFNVFWWAEELYISWILSTLHLLLCALFNDFNQAALIHLWDKRDSLYIFLMRLWAGNDLLSRIIWVESESKSLQVIDPWFADHRIQLNLNTFPRLYIFDVLSDDPLPEDSLERWHPRLQFLKIIDCLELKWYRCWIILIVYLKCNWNSQYLFLIEIVLHSSTSTLDLVL